MVLLCAHGFSMSDLRRDVIAVGIYPFQYIFSLSGRFGHIVACRYIILGG
jgi:hypothetical protein